MQFSFRPSWILVLLFLISQRAFACEFASSHPKWILSAPMVYVLEELNLLNDSSIQGITDFAKPESFKGKRLPGGLFLSAKWLSSLPKSELYVDQARDLKELLQNYPLLNTYFISSRAKDPFQVIEQLYDLLLKHTTKCEPIILKKKNLLEQKELEFRNKSWREGYYLFFLGEISLNRPFPNMLMVHDGFVLSLLQSKKIRTYPTTLAYTTYSSKVLQDLKDKNVYYIGVDTDKDQSFDLKKISEHTWNLQSTDGLIPGIPQLRLLHLLAQEFEVKHVED